MRSTRRSRTLIAAVTLALSATAGLGTASADEAGAAACSWAPLVPFPSTSSSGNGWVMSNGVAVGCSSTNDWYAAIERHYAVIGWTPVAEVSWQGNGGPQLKYDCPNGSTHRYRAVMQNLENFDLKYTRELDIRCP